MKKIKKIEQKNESKNVKCIDCKWSNPIRVLSGKMVINDCKFFDGINVYSDEERECENFQKK